MPSVTMNGTTRSWVVNKPVTRPQPAQTATAASAAPTGDTTLPSTTAMTTVASATAEPTARSMPLEMITIVMPSAARPTMVVCRAMVSRLRPEWKLSGPIRANSKYTTPSASSGPKRFSQRFPIAVPEGLGEMFKVAANWVTRRFRPKRTSAAGC